LIGIGYAPDKKAGGEIATGPSDFVLNGPLATSLTWLQADRPNHHGTEGF
jgi:hypothetical protein